MPPRSHARAGEREREREQLPPAAERVHPHAVAGGWRVWKCHFRGWQHLRAVKISPLAWAHAEKPRLAQMLLRSGGLAGVESPARPSYPFHLLVV